MKIELQVEKLYWGRIISMCNGATILFVCYRFFLPSFFVLDRCLIEIPSSAPRYHIAAIFGGFQAFPQLFIPDAKKRRPLGQACSLYILHTVAISQPPLLYKLASLTGSQPPSLLSIPEKWSLNVASTIISEPYCYVYIVYAYTYIYTYICIYVLVYMYIHM